MNNLLLLAMPIEGKAPPTGCDIVNWSLPMKGLSSTVSCIYYDCIGECYYTAHQKKLPLHHYPPVTGAFSSLLTITHDTNLTSSWTFNITVGVITSDYVSSVLSVNGSRLTSISKFNLSQTIIQPNILTQVIKFLYNSSDEGFYIQQLHISDPYHLYCALRDQGYRCFDHYHYTELYINLRSVSLVAFPFILTTYST